MQDKFTVH